MDFKPSKIKETLSERTINDWCCIQGPEECKNVWPPEIKGIIQLKQRIKENVWPPVCLVEDAFCFLSFFSFGDILGKETKHFQPITDVARTFFSYSLSLSLSLSLSF